MKGWSRFVFTPQHETRIQTRSSSAAFTGNGTNQDAVLAYCTGSEASSQKQRRHHCSRPQWEQHSHHATVQWRIVFVGLTDRSRDQWEMVKSQLTKSNEVSMHRLISRLLIICLYWGRFASCWDSFVPSALWFCSSKRVIVIKTGCWNLTAVIFVFFVLRCYRSSLVPNLFSKSWFAQWLKLVTVERFDLVELVTRTLLNPGSFDWCDLWNISQFFFYFFLQMTVFPLMSA